MVGRRGLFVAEGTVVVRALCNSLRFRPQSLLVLENRLAGLSEMIDGLDESIPVYIVNRALIDAIAGFPMHRGVLAIGERNHEEDALSLADSFGSSALVVVCVGIGSHDNMGAIFRNAAAFGAATVLCDETCCDPLYRKALRVSVGSVLKVPYARAGAASSIVDLLTARGFRQYALSPGGATSIRDLRPNGRTALYLGAEGDGLPHQVMERMEAVSIPMTPGFDSLNVAAASAIALHQLFAGRTALG